MIKVTRLNGKEYYVNCDMIEFMEETPDTVVTLLTGQKVVVKETAAEVVERIVDYRGRCFVRMPTILPPEMLTDGR